MLANSRQAEGSASAGRGACMAEDSRGRIPLAGSPERRRNKELLAHSPFGTALVIRDRGGIAVFSPAGSLHRGIGDRRPSRHCDATERRRSAARQSTFRSSPQQLQATPQACHTTQSQSREMHRQDREESANVSKRQQFPHVNYLDRNNVSKLGKLRDERVLINRVHQVLDVHVASAELGSV